MHKHIAGFQLNRDTHQRLALFKNLVCALVLKEEIMTTKAKAKAVTPIFEKLITKAKTNSVAGRREVQAYVQDADVVKRLFAEIAPRYATVKGGYTKLILVGNRRGDNASMVKLALTKKTVVAPVKTKVEEATVEKKKAKTIAAVTPEKVTATKQAPKLVRRTGKRGDK